MQLKNYLAGRILAVTAACLLVFAAIAVAQAVHDIRSEGQGARQMQLLTAGLYELQAAPAGRVPAVLDKIRDLAESDDLRHVQFELRGANNKTLMRSEPRYSGHASQKVGEWLASFNRRVPRENDTVSWELQRTDGLRWTVLLSPNLVSEQEEAAENLLGLLVMMVALTAALVAGTTLALGRAMRPINRLLGILAQMGRRDYTARMPSSPINEIRVVGQAVNQLAQSLTDLESSRKMLSIKLLSLQEEERAHLARELHDELGQKLTVIRMNAGYLSKTSVLDTESKFALSDISDATASIQKEVRDLLGRLRPHGPGHRLDAREFERLVRLLVDGWRDTPGTRQRFDLTLNLGDQPLHETVLLAIYRITQEALTNIARHASATEVDVSIVRDGDVMLWSVRDNGRGIDSLPDALGTGSGLAGMRERIWSIGGTFEIEAHQPGITLSARVPIPDPFGDQAEPRDGAAPHDAEPLVG